VNTAEYSLRIFKNHFIVGLAATNLAFYCTSRII